MKNLIVFFVLVVSFSLFALELKIEKDPVFKSLLSEFENPGQNTLLYHESENYRLDLTLYDLVDKVSLLTENSKFMKYKQQIDTIAKKDLVYFYDWFNKIKSIAQNDTLFLKHLNKQLYIQLYSKNAIALLPNYKYIDFKRIKDIGLLRRITRYNEIASSPEAAGLLAAFEQTTHNVFSTKKLTVSKFKRLKRRAVKKIKKTYLNTYISLLRNQNALDTKSFPDYATIKFKQSRKNTVIAFEKTEPKPESEQALESYKPSTRYINGVKIFDLLQGISHKYDVLNYLNQKFAEDDIHLAKQMGYILITPIFIEKNWKKFNMYLKEYTLSKYMDVDDDQYSFQIRKWIKENRQKVLTDSNNRFKYDNPKRLPTRVELLTQYELLSSLYPKKPWASYSGPDFIDRKGRGKYFEKRGLGKIIGSGIKKLLKVENYTSVIAGTATLVLTGGNYSVALSAKSMVKKAVYTKKHDKDWGEFLKSAPKELLGSILLGAGFSAGRLYKILALGSAQGALQSIMTGQDVKTGALVGVGVKLLDYYVLPYALSKPMSDGIDSKSLKINRRLEIIEKTVKRSLQGALVAAFTGDSIGGGALKGGSYGFLSSNLTIWFLGTRYNAFRDFNENAIDDMIAAENAFQNDVGRGYFQIDRQLIMDANFRAGGVLPNVISASITLPGSVSMHSQHVNQLHVMTHEAHHLMQQHQSGVFGFYLLRYLPTSLTSGYYGHPDENFLKDFLKEYLHTTVCIC